MSSFRPDAHAERVAFVPTPLAAPPWSAAAALSAGSDEGAIALESGHVDAGDALPSQASDGETNVPSSPSPEEIAALEQAAFERGVASARAEQDALARTCSGMDGAIAELRAAAATAITRNRGAALDLCRALVRHWVQAELVVDAERYAAALERALEGIGEARAIRLRLCASDQTTLEREAADAVARWQEEGVSIEAEAALSPGEFRIETETGGLDGTLDAISDRLREALEPAIGVAPPELDE